MSATFYVMILRRIGGWTDFDDAAEDVRPGRARFLDLDAELGAEVGDDGGGGANGEQGIREWGLGI